MLLKALYPYNGSFEGALKFTKGDIFLRIRDENDYWQLVCREDGSVGCIPRNYVEQLVNNDQGLIYKYAITTINLLEKSDNLHINDKSTILRDLRKVAKDAKGLTGIGDGPIVSSSPTALKNGLLNNTDHSKRYENNIKTSLPFQLVDILRLGTDASFSDCRWGLLAILTHLSNEIPSFKRDADLLYDKLTDGELNQKKPIVYCQSPDWFKLKKLFGLIEARHKNNEECNWQLHQNQSNLSLCYDKLFDLIVKADSGLVLHYLSSTGYLPLSCLIELYQREHRPALRHRLLLIISVICCLSQTCVRVGVQSVLPSQLIRELTMCDDSTDVLYVNECMRVLTILLARNPEIPANIKDNLNYKFCLRLLQFVGVSTGDNGRPACSQPVTEFPNLISMKSELAATTRQQQQPALGGHLSEAASLLLLAVNWHFCSLRTIRSAAASATGADATAGAKKVEFIPVVMAILEQPDSPASQHFIRLVVELFNREVDPIFLIDYCPQASSDRVVTLLKRWVEVLSQSPPDSALMASCFQPTAAALDGSRENLDLAGYEEEEGEETNNCQVSTKVGVSEANAGQYARYFWSENLASRLRAREKPSTGPPVKLSSAVAPMTPMHSVVKLVCDVFSSSRSARLIYGGDLEGIIDVICRQLCSLSPDVPATADYLVLFGLLVTNTDYLSRGKQAYKINDLLSSIRSLLDLATGLPRSANVQRCVDYANGILKRIRLSKSD